MEKDFQTQRDNNRFPRPDVVRLLYTLHTKSILNWLF